jgi:hypothetical protein
MMPRVMETNMDYIYTRHFISKRLVIFITWKAGDIIKNGDDRPWALRRWEYGNAMMRHLKFSQMNWFSDIKHYCS